MSVQPNPTQPTGPTTATAESSEPGETAERVGGEGMEAPATNSLTKSQLKRQRKKQKQGSAAAATGNVGGKVADSSVLLPPMTKMECVPVQEPLSSQFELELDWCCEQLQLGLRTRKASPKQAEEAVRALRVLSSSKAPPIRKRQVMQAVFGDYRKKMANDRTKNIRSMETALKTMKLVPMPVNPKSVFYKTCVNNQRHKMPHLANGQAAADGTPVSAAAASTEHSCCTEDPPAAQLTTVQHPFSEAPPADTAASADISHCSAREFKFNFFDVSNSCSSMNVKVEGSSS